MDAVLLLFEEPVVGLWVVMHTFVVGFGFVAGLLVLVALVVLPEELLGWVLEVFYLVALPSMDVQPLQSTHLLDRGGVGIILVELVDPQSLRKVVKGSWLIELLAVEVPLGLVAPVVRGLSPLLVLL